MKIYIVFLGYLNTIRKQLPSLWWIITILLVSLIVFSASSLFVKVSDVRASDWAGWDAIDIIYYDPGQEDANNPYLETAAEDLKTYLEQMSGKSWTIENVIFPAAPAIYLSVNANDPDVADLGDEAFKIEVDFDGVEITGKTALACRHGAYYLLDEILGVRWFFPDEAWHVVPDSLTDLSASTVKKEPDFFGRQLVFANGQTCIRDWNKFNRMWGAKYYHIGETYGGILNDAIEWMNMSAVEKREYYLTDDNADCFLPEDKWLESGYPTYPFKLNPVNETVQEWACSYANSLMGTTRTLTDYYGELPYGSVSTCPSDGLGWYDGDDPGMYQEEGNEYYQTVTDWVYTLSNAVADNVTATNPNFLVGSAAYAANAGIPSIELNPNIIAVICTQYLYSPHTLLEIINGIGEKGCVLGIYDYPQVWAGTKEKPIRYWEKVAWLGYFHDLGVTFYNSEAVGTSWGARGLTFYAISKILWNADLDLQEIYDDFYEKAFGDASSVMQDYYETYQELASTSIEGIARMFNLLDDAITLASGDSDVLERLYQLVYYTYVAWLYHAEGYKIITDEQLEDLYTLVTKIYDLYIITYDKVEDALHDELTSRGYSEGEITALQDFTNPTSTEANSYLGYALSTLSAYNMYHHYIDAFRPYRDYEAIGDTDIFEGDPIPIYGGASAIVPSDGFENITIKFKNIYDERKIYWHNPYGMEVDSVTVEDTGTWQEHTFEADIAGNWKVTIPGGFTTMVDCDNHAMGIQLKPDISIRTYNEGTTFYLYVPSGTQSFSIGITPYGSGGSYIGTITDAVENVTNFNLDEDDGETTFVFDSPKPGLLEISLPQQNYYATFNIKGIPAIAWHDPEYLISEGADSPVPPVLNPIGDKTTYVGEPLEFKVYAYDSNFDTITYSTANLPSWAIFNPLTHTFSGIPDQEDVHTNVHFEVSDGSMTDSENIEIVVLGSPDINNDGMINVLDLIHVAQHWGETGQNGWIPEDINNDGTVNISDIIVIVQNWK